MAVNGLESIVGNEENAISDFLFHMRTFNDNYSRYREKAVSDQISGDVEAFAIGELVDVYKLLLREFPIVLNSEKVQSDPKLKKEILKEVKDFFEIYLGLNRKYSNERINKFNSTLYEKLDSKKELDRYLCLSYIVFLGDQLSAAKLIKEGAKYKFTNSLGGTSLTPTQVIDNLTKVMVKYRLDDKNVYLNNQPFDPRDHQTLLKALGSHMIGIYESAPSITSVDLRLFVYNNKGKATLALVD